MTKFAQVRYFDAECGVQAPTNAQCPWCTCPVGPGDAGFLISHHPQTPGGLAFASAYHRECWNARFAEGLYEDSGEPELARAVYLTGEHVAVSGGHQALDVTVDRLLAHPPAPGVSVRA